MKIPFLILFVAFSNATLFSQNPLFVAPVKNKFGYIDTAGKMVITPRFRNAGEFSEGLAAVRENGRYGFINGTGEYVLPPAYDLAQKFEGGMAKVYIDGAPVFIDHQGRQVLPGDILRVKLVGNHVAIVTTAGFRTGMVNLNNYSFIADTVYESIGDFSCGLAVVREHVAKGSKKQPKKAVIDTSGKLVVPFGVYDDIRNFSEGYAVVRKGNFPKHRYGLIDTKGKQLFLRQYPRLCSPDGEVCNGRVQFSTGQSWVFGKDEAYFAGDSVYNGYIDLRGNIIFSDSGIIRKADFSDGRVFMEREEERYYIYDTAFCVIGPMNYSSVLHGGFVNGLAIVRDDVYWGIVDTNGKIVVPFRYSSINNIQGNYFFYSYLNANDEKLCGVSTLAGETVVPMALQDYDRRGFVNGLLNAIVNGRQVYINKQGKTIWEEDTTGNSDMRLMNIDYMTRGYCYAFADIRGPGTGHGGAGNPARNLPKSLPDNFSNFPNKLQLYIDTVALDSFLYTYPGYKLLLINNTSDTVVLQAQDSRLYINLQALDKNNEWRDIEYLPSSWCGNSYHTLALPGKSYWSFTIPRYEGEVQTMIRVKLSLDGPRVRKHAKPRLIYSYPIRGSINPGQFWNKQGYRPKNFMDPYFD